jgi:hypothetical protein
MATGTALKHIHEPPLIKIDVFEADLRVFRTGSMKSPVGLFLCSHNSHETIRSEVWDCGQVDLMFDHEI